MRWIGWVVLVVACFAGMGCSSYATFIETLNARQLASCIRWQGAISAGAGMGGSGGVSAFTVTGGMAIKDCIAAKEAGLF